MVSFTVYKGSKDGSIVKSQSTRSDELKDDEVLVRITASGVCGTDEHYRSSDMVLGHEGVGVVEALGPDAKLLKVGDRVGWGYMHNTCGHCEYCLTGLEQFCEERAMYAFTNLDQGSFGEAGVWREAFLFPIPDGLTDAEAAPLMCGGATVFNALYAHGVKSTDRVGIIGLGGLGHLAVQFARAMGCDVTVFSGSETKREEALKLGAHSFYATNGKESIDIGEKKLKCLIVTTSFQPDWHVFLPIMANNSVIFPLSIDPSGIFQIPYMQWLLAGIRIQATIIAPRNTHRLMLDFAARNGVKPVYNAFPLTQEGITDAMQTLRDGKMRYRGVLLPEGAVSSNETVHVH